MGYARFALAPLTLAVALGAWSVPASAAADFDVDVDPDSCYWRGEIRVFGFAKPTGTTNPEVLLELTKPGAGGVVTETVMARSNGLYEMVFDETTEFGTWKVKATHQETGKTATTSFQVATAAFLTPLVQEMQRVTPAVSTATQEFREELGPGFPGFPGKRQMKEEAQQIVDKLAELGQSLAKLDAAARKLEQALQKQDAQIPAVAKQHLADAAKEQAEATDHVQLGMADIERLIDETRQATDTCFMFQAYGMMFERMGRVLTVVDGKLTKMLRNWALAEAVQGLPFPVRTQLRAIQTIVLAPNFIGALRFTTVTALQLGAEVSDLLVARFCQEFRGTVEGEYYAEILHQEMPFLTMSYVYDAQIRMVFQKRNPGQPVVALKGRIMGRIRDPECEMSMMPFDLADTVSPSWCRSAVPEIGSRSFLLYLTGRAFEDRLEIDFDRTGHDFDLKTRGYYVMVSSHQPVPIPGDVVFPLMDAEWFFTRITHLSNPNVDFITLPIEVTDEGSEASKEYEREMNFDETPQRKGVHIEMEMEIELCSGCS